MAGFLSSVDAGEVAAMEAAVAATPNLVSVVNHGGDTLLHMAAARGSAAAAQVLLQARAQVDVENSIKATPLHLAVKGAQKETVELLLRACSSVNARDNRRRTPLHWAASGGNKLTTTCLLRANAKVDVKDKYGETPLHVAARSSTEDVVEVLLLAGAHVDAKSKFGATPFDEAEARKTKNLDIMCVLVRWGALIPAHLRRGGRRARLSVGRKNIVDVLDKTVVMTEQERLDAIEAWRAATGEGDTDLIVPDPVSHSLAVLQAAHDGFVADPDSLSVGALEAALTPPSERDIRWHVLAHQLLLFASRRDFFRAETLEEAAELREAWYERMYAPTVRKVKPCDHDIYLELVRNAKVNGLLEQCHLASTVMGLELHKTLYNEISDIRRRLQGLEDKFHHAGQMLVDTMERLGNLQQYLADKHKHDRKVALATSAFKVGLSLAPIVGGALSVTVEAVAELVDGASVAAEAMVQARVDPADLSAARKVLLLVLEAEPNLTPYQATELRAVVHPFESVAAVVEEIDEAEVILEVRNEVEGASFNDAEGDTTGGCAADGPPSDTDSDPADDFRSAVQEEAVDLAAGALGERYGVAPSQPNEQPAAPAAPAATSADAPPASVPTAACCPVGTHGRGTPPRSETGPLAGPPPWSVAVPAQRPPPLGGTAVAAPYAAAAVAAAAVLPSGAVAADPLPTDEAAFYEGARDWSARTVADRLVAYVARGYEPAWREELATVVRAQAVGHRVTGVSIVGCRRRKALATALLGTMTRCEGAFESVVSFIADVQRRDAAP